MNGKEDYNPKYDQKNSQIGGFVDKAESGSNIQFNQIINQQQSSRNRFQQILLQQVGAEVESRISSSLHNRVYIVLNTEQNPSQVECPWQIEVKVGSQPKVTLHNTEITTVFDQPEIAGRLLILGQPGAGKTTMLLKLASELVKRANNNPTYPVPVLFSLPSWTQDKQSIRDWLIEQLKEKYTVRQNIGQQWVDNQEILPLLDGLDELAAERQELCVRKINDFLHSSWANPLVICSRIEEYQRYETLLQLNNSLELSPFTSEQVYQYLKFTGNLELYPSISQDRNLNVLATMPLFLFIIVLSIQEISLDVLAEKKSSQERLDYLFDTYIHMMLKRSYSGKQLKAENTERWLNWLAHVLIENQSAEFFIEKIQPNLLRNKYSTWLYNSLFWGVVITLMIALVLGLTVCLLYGLFSVNIDKLVEKLIAALCGGLIVLLPFGLIGLFSGLFTKPIKQKIIPMEIIYFSWNKFLLLLISAFFIFFIFVLIVRLFIVQNNIIDEMFFILFMSLAFGIIHGINQVEIKNKTIPNQGIWQSTQNSIILSLIAGLIATILLFIVQHNNHDINLNKVFISSVIGGLFFGLLIGIPTSGIPVIQHFILRIILWFNGYAPWNYAKFLDYATNRLFLQRVGGSYRFIHDLLRQHFAKKYSA